MLIQECSALWCLGLVHWVDTKPISRVIHFCCQRQVGTEVIAAEFIIEVPNANHHFCCRILTDGQLRVIEKESKAPYPNIYALGDCATILDNDLPATAQGLYSLVKQIMQCILTNNVCIQLHPKKLVSSLKVSKAWLSHKAQCAKLECR